MTFTRYKSKRRQGLTLVETAFVMIPLTMLLFGIFVYGQLLMDWNLLINAVQVGCRYALANNTNPSVNTQVQSIVNGCLTGRSTSLSGFTITLSGTHQGVATAVNNLAPGDPITVSITATYQFPNVIPLVTMPSTMPMNSSSTMICEGGN